jgi:predicted nucleotidyltransferase component of viral defense system
MSDVGASILTKLKNKAMASGISYQQCLQLFFQEEFLRRLEKSKYAGNLILKGGLFIYILTEFESRVTVDIDFLLERMNSDMKHMDEVIGEILSTPTGNNETVTLLAKKSAPISLMRKYPGVRTQIIGKIKNVRVPFDVDIGVGDVILPKAKKHQVKPILDGFEGPTILTYSLESVISEKLDAIVQRFELTGRMKDFFDIYYLSRTHDFDGKNLCDAIEQTFINRGTPYGREYFSRIKLLADDKDMQIKWRYFLKSIQGKEISLESVIEGIVRFLQPVWDAILNNSEFQKKWSHSNSRWGAYAEQRSTHDNK